MAKRELIDKNSIELVSLEDSLRYMEWHKDSEVELDIKATIITEEEIIKPYLEKLNEHIINFPWGDTSGDFMTGVNAVSNLIDNLLTEKGAEE